MDGDKQGAPSFVLMFIFRYLFDKRMASLLGGDENNSKTSFDGGGWGRKDTTCISWRIPITSVDRGTGVVIIFRSCIVIHFIQCKLIVKFNMWIVDHFNWDILQNKRLFYGHLHFLTFKFILIEFLSFCSNWFVHNIPISTHDPYNPQ